MGVSHLSQGGVHPHHLTPPHGSGHSTTAPQQQQQAASQARVFLCYWLPLAAQPNRCCSALEVWGFSGGLALPQIFRCQAVQHVYCHASPCGCGDKRSCCVFHSFLQLPVALPLRHAEASGGMSPGPAAAARSCFFPGRRAADTIDQLL